MSFLIPTLRFIHILSAIFWVGTTFFMVLFLEPTIRSLGPDGGKFMQGLMGGTQFSLTISASALLTVLAGLLMYGAFSGGWSPAVMFGARLPLTLGALAGIAAAVVGGTVTGRSAGKLTALGKQIATQGGPPSPTQMGEMQKFQAAIRQGTIWSAVLMVLAVIGMTW